MKKITILFLVSIVLFLLIWGISLAKSEVLTLIHGHEFSDPNLYKDNTMFVEKRYLKVLEYSQDIARVYYVSINNLGADVLTFVKEKNQWKFYKWETVWAKGGSASEVIWPYWWHFIYGGL